MMVIDSKEKYVMVCALPPEGHRNCHFHCSLSPPKRMLLTHSLTHSSSFSFTLACPFQKDVADFVTLVATYSEGFSIILERNGSVIPGVYEPVMQLACLDASLAIK